MKIGIVGYQGAGKSALFEWLTGVAADPALAHAGQSAMAPIADPRMDALCQLYAPKKTVHAALELADTPGLDRAHTGNAARLAVLREAGCLVLVVAAYAGRNPAAELNSFAEDLLLADLEIVSGRVDRLRESIKKPRPGREAEMHELAALEPLLEALESGRALRDVALTDEQAKAIRSFALLTEKPKLVVVNVADDDDRPQRFVESLPSGQAVATARLGLECELAAMDAEERAEFERDYGLEPGRRDYMVHRILEVSGYLLYFTASEKEVRSWLLRRGGTALEAADNVHSDLARGFIRAETIAADELVRAGSEREAKAQALFRQEPKDYVVKDGDVLHIKFNV